LCATDLWTASASNRGSQVHSSWSFFCIGLGSNCKRRFYGCWLLRYRWFNRSYYSDTRIQLTRQSNVSSSHVAAVCGSIVLTRQQCLDSHGRNGICWLGRCRRQSFYRLLGFGLVCVSVGLSPIVIYLTCCTHRGESTCRKSKRSSKQASHRPLLAIDPRSRSGEQV